MSLKETVVLSQVHNSENKSNFQNLMKLMTSWIMRHTKRKAGNKTNFVMSLLFWHRNFMVSVTFYFQIVFYFKTKIQTSQQKLHSFLKFLRKILYARKIYFKFIVWVLKMIFFLAFDNCKLMPKCNIEMKFSAAVEVSSLL